MKQKYGEKYCRTFPHIKIIEPTCLQTSTVNFIFNLIAANLCKNIVVSNFLDKKVTMRNLK